jgi:hypothetical protein
VIWTGGDEVNMGIKNLKRIMLFAVIFDVLMLLFEYRTIQFGAFCLGMKTSEIVYDRRVEANPKESATSSFSKRN